MKAPIPPDIGALVTDLILNLTGLESVNPDIELLDQGLDSLTATELVNSLESELGIEIEPDFLFEHPLPEQFIAALEALTPQNNQEITHALV